MKLRQVLALSTLSVMLTAGSAFAQDNHDDHGYVKHDEWKKGATMRSEDWSRGQRVDYRQHHLPAPRRGYEWRQVDGNYVMAAVATGVIASVVAASSH